MAHGKIYQISYNSPIAKDDYIKEERYYENFVGLVATSIETEDECERLADIEELKREMEGIAEFDGIKFCIINKEKYFEPRFRRFKETLKQLDDITLAQFAGAERDYLSSLMWNLEGFYKDSDYIDDDGEYGGLESFSDFMRRIQNGDEFYVGTVFDIKY